MEITWIGPFEFGSLLRDRLDPEAPWPPISGSAYLVTQHFWDRQPTPKSVPLYVGGNTGHSQRFRTRIGDLLADSFGFFTPERGHHSGGQSIWKWSNEHVVNPLALHLAWVQPGNCHRCLESSLVSQLKPLLNKHRPASCREHPQA